MFNVQLDLADDENSKYVFLHTHLKPFLSVLRNKSPDLASC